MPDRISPRNGPVPDDRVEGRGDAWLDEALRALPREAVADDGFTVAVMAKLPPARSAASTVPGWRRPVVALIWLFAALAALAVLPETLEYAYRAAVAALSHVRVSAVHLGALVAALAAASWASVWFAVREE